MKKIGLLAGSLRSASYAKKVARNLGLMTSNRVVIVPISIDELPLYHENLTEAEQAACDGYKRQIGQLDGFCFVTPEINRSIPGCLKNALDIASISDHGSLWAQKPVLIVSVSTGKLGGLSASQHLKQIALALGMNIIQPTELYLGQIQKQLSVGDLLTDERELALLRPAMVSLETVVTGEPSALQFEFTPDRIRLVVAGQQVGQGTLQLGNRQLIITAITVDSAQQGRGYGNQIMVKLLILAQLFQLTIVPRCAYSRGFFARHPAVARAMCSMV